MFVKIISYFLATIGVLWLPFWISLSIWFDGKGMIHQSNTAFIIMMVPLGIVVLIAFFTLIKLASDGILEKINEFIDDNL